MDASSQLYDIYGMCHIPFWQRAGFQIFVVGSILFFIVLIGFLLFRRYRKRKKVSAWTAALHALDDMGRSDLMNPSQAKQFYLNLTALLKRYFSQRYKTDVRGKTDDEMVTFLHKTSMPQSVLMLVQEVAQGGVIIKFANGKTVCNQMEQDLHRSVTIITKTIPSRKQQ